MSAQLRRVRKTPLSVSCLDFCVPQLKGEPGCLVDVSTLKVSALMYPEQLFIATGSVEQERTSS